MDDMPPSTFLPDETMTTRLRLLALALLLPFAVALPAGAQSLFAPAARVNESVVTNYEVDQRRRMLELFSAPDATDEGALEDLIEERLQLAEAERLGIEIDRERVLGGMEEFARRAELDREGFVAELGRAGVAEESYEDFVRAGIAWREVVAARFGGGQTVVAEDEVERAADAPPDAELRVLLNEIIIPADTPERQARAEALAPQITAITDFGSFAAAAREYSATPSRERGGAIDWLDLANLPPQLRPILQGLSPGEVSPPIPLPNALAFFQLREIGETGGGSQPTELDYATLAVPGGRSDAGLAEAARIAARVDTCGDLYGAVQDAGTASLQRDTMPIGQVPRDVALELARLDPGEISTSLTAGDDLILLMLCGRSYRAPQADAPNIGQIRGGLVTERVSQKADNLLAELRANATIRIE